MSPTIIIADDHPLVLKGLHDFLIENNYNVLATAKNGKEALTLIKAHNPDIAILDIKMPYLTGLEIAEKCKADKSVTKIILITFEKDEKTYNAAKAIGVYGYVLKEFALEEIENCITSVIKDKAYFSPELIAYIKVNDTPEKIESLTAAEKNILKLISDSKTAKEIAKELFISARTVEKHKSHIRTKLVLSSKSEVGKERVDALTRKLITISNEATISEFPDYRLDYRFAKRAVEETLGDINDFEIDENGDPVTDNLLPDDPNEPDEELESDRDQTPTEKPEGCP